MTIEELAERYPGGRWSNGSYRALCPAHKDVKPSLGIDRGKNGGIVMRCGAGCATKEVLAAVGLSLKDLAPPITNGHGPAAPITYRYDDAAGNCIATKHRKPDKKFLWQQANGEWNLKGVEIPLFGLPELLQSKPGEVVLIVEGEKDVLTARRLGFVATTNPDGAAKDGQHPKWKPAYTEWLAGNLSGRRLLVVPDNDDAGRAHAGAVLSSLTAAGLDCRLLELDGIPEKGDLTDWTQQGGTADELRELIEESPASDSEDPYSDLEQRLYNGPALEALDIPEPEWLVPGLVARGVLTLLAGMGKLGKSVLAHQLCVAVSSGGVWLNQALPAGRALYINWEDPVSLTRARARQQFDGGALPENYHVLDVPLDTSLNRLLAWMTRAIEQHGIELVVIDPLNLAARWADENDNAEVGPTMRNFQEVAVRTGAAVLLVHHIRKSGGEFGMELRGAGAIFNGLQGFLSFKRHGEGQYRLDVQTKMTGEQGGEKSLMLKREPHTLTWHVISTMSQHAVDRQEAIARIIDAIQANPGATRGEIGDSLGLKKSTLQKYLLPLIEKGTIFEQKRMARPGDEPNRPPMGLYVRGESDV